LKIEDIVTSHTGKAPAYNGPEADYGGVNDKVKVTLDDMLSGKLAEKERERECVCARVRARVALKSYFTPD
jgi:hypothetical protein